MTSGRILHGTARSDYDGPKRSLVLSGGGVRLSYQAGVVKALFDHGLVFDHIDGTSGGSLNLSMILSGLSPREMCSRWRTQNPCHFAGFASIGEALNPADLTAVGSADGLVDKVFPHLGIDVGRIRQATGVVGTYNILNYNDKLVEVVEHTEIDVDWIVAGMSLPGVMPPVIKDGITYLDTGFMQDANPLEAVRRGAEEVWLVWGMGNTPAYHGGALRLYVQMLEMSANGALNIQMERIAELNERIAAGDSPYGQTGPVVLHVIRPDYPLPLDPDLFLDRIDHATLVEMGYADARRYLGRVTANGEEPTYRATQMTEPRLGLRFRTSMSGDFALGATDPIEGRKKGKRDNTEFSIRATIDIRDIVRWTQAPERAERLTGRVGFTPFGTDIMGYGGTFRVLSPSEDPAMASIGYELAFDHEGKTYCISGRKTLKDDPGFDLMVDMTRLYATLHEGPTRSGQIIGAGVLRFSLGQLSDMVRTFTVTHASCPKDKAVALGLFGRLFLGELWDRYARFAE